MGINFSNTSMLSLLAAPVQSLAAWFVPVQSAARPFRTATKPHQMVLPFTADATGPGADGAAASTPGRLSPRASSSSGLRIVREFDSAVSPSCAGRMVISGRMADVCAELERMSQADVQPR